MPTRLSTKARHAGLSAPARTLLRQYATSLPVVLRSAFPENWLDGKLPFAPKPYTVLVASFFGIRDRDVIAEACAASLLMELHCCLQDARLDGHPSCPIAVTEPLCNLLLTESVARFEDLSGHARALRPYVRRAFTELAEGYAEESRPAGDQDFFRSVTNRAAPFHILIAALGLRAGQADRIEQCSLVARHLLFWFQIIDDTRDWLRDLTARRHSYLLHRLTPLVGDKPFDAWTERDVENALYLFGGAESLLDEAVQHLQAARQHAAGARLLTRMIDQMIRLHRQLRDRCMERKREFLQAA